MLLGFSGFVSGTDPTTGDTVITITDMESKLSSTQDDYHSLMTAKMLEITEGDMEAAKARLSKLIRSVNKCITLLSEQ